MRAVSTLVVLAVVSSALAAPSSVPQYLEERGGDKKLGKKTSKLPGELRNQIGEHVKADKVHAARTGSKSKHTELMTTIKGGTPRKWTDQTSAAYEVAERNRNRREEFDLEERGGDKKLGKKTSKLPGELRNQIGEHVKADKVHAARTGSNSKHTELMTTIKGGTPRKWTDQTSAAYDVAERNRNRELDEDWELEAREDEYLEERGGDKKLGKKVSSLPGELRNQIGDHIRADKVHAARTGPNSKHAEIMTTIKGGTPRTWTDQTSAAYGVAERNRNRRAVFEGDLDELD